MYQGHPPSERSPSFCEINVKDDNGVNSFVRNQIRRRQLMCNGSERKGLRASHWDGSMSPIDEEASYAATMRCRSRES